MNYPGFVLSHEDKETGKTQYLKDYAIAFRPVCKGVLAPEKVLTFTGDPYQAHRFAVQEAAIEFGLQCIDNCTFLVEWAEAKSWRA